MFDTVEGHTQSGAIVARNRVTVDDLEYAATWLEAYEGDPEESAEILTALATVAARLRNDAARRTGRSTS